MDRITDKVRPGKRLQENPHSENTVRHFTETVRLPC